MSEVVPEAKKFVFILSSGRTGTAALARYLHRGCKDTTALHEPKPSRRLRISSNRFLAGKNTREEMIRRLQAARFKILKGLQTSTYIEANPFLFGFLDVLGEVFDNPQVVHVTRDPRTAATSVLNKGAHHGVKKLFLDWVPYWTVRPEDLEARPEKLWRDMTLLERTAWFWQLVNRHLSRGASIYGEKYRRFKYEDLFRSDGSGLQELAQWIEVEQHEDAFSDLLKTKVNVSTYNLASPWNRWSNSERSLLLNYCKPLMDQYGYDTGSPPAEDT